MIPPDLSYRDLVQLYEFEVLKKLLEERDRRYEERFQAQREALSAAFAAQEKLTQTIFSMNDKAISKAEEAQMAYNSRSNEFRAALDDAQRNLMGRSEALARWTADEDRIAKLESFKDGITGRDRGVGVSWGILLGAAALAGSVVAIVARFV